MSRHMIKRTTVRLPAELLRKAKRKADAEGRTLTALMEDGLRYVVSDKPPGESQARTDHAASQFRDRGLGCRGVDLKLFRAPEE